MQRIVFGAVLFGLAVTAEAAVVTVDVVGTITLDPFASLGVDEIYLDGADYQGTFRYYTNQLPYTSFQQGPTRYGTNYWALSGEIRIFNRPSGQTDIRIGYIPYINLSNSFGDSNSIFDDDWLLFGGGELVVDEIGYGPLPSITLRFPTNYLPGDGEASLPVPTNDDFRTDSLLGFSNVGYLLEYSATVSSVPIPAGIWLFSSSLGVVTLIRRATRRRR